jgi:hypothetical protein
VFRQYKNARFATCLHLEWDIVSAFHEIHSMFPWLPHLQHVKGHQDDHSNVEDLDLPTLMNIEADKLATIALKGGKSRPIVPFDPSTGVMLTLGGIVITRQIESTIEQYEHTAPLQKYYIKRFNWSATILKTIDWDGFSMAYTKFPRTRTFFSKFGWKKLPTGKRLHPTSSSYDHRCPSCDKDFECDSHVFCCSHLLQKQWRTDLINSIHDKYGSYIDPDLLTVAKIGLNSYLQNCIPPFSVRFPNAQYPKLNVLIQQQSLIGWDQFFR